MSILERHQVWATTEYCREVVPGIVEIRFRAPEIARNAQPGQFVHLRVDKGLDPLLRRPLSIGEVAEDTVDLLFRVVGRGTERLAKAVEGETYDLIGPLGNPFTLHPDRPAVMVAGGLGIAVFPFLVEQLREGGCGEMFVVYGARTAKELVWMDRLEKMGVRVLAATDDGTGGHCGRCTDLLSEAIAECSSSPAIYACGPVPMFNATLRVVEDPKIPLQLCYEQRMGCGIGACLTCVIQTNQGYVRGCMEGPVLDGSLFR